MAFTGHHSGNSYRVFNLVRRCLTPAHLYPHISEWFLTTGVVSLSFLAYLRHSLIGFNKKSDGQLTGQEVEVGLSVREKGTLGKRKALSHHQETWKETGLITGLECIASYPCGWIWLGGWVNSDELVENLPN